MKPEVVGHIFSPKKPEEVARNTFSPNGSLPELELPSHPFNDLEIVGEVDWGGFEGFEIRDPQESWEVFLAEKQGDYFFLILPMKQINVGGLEERHFFPSEKGNEFFYFDSGLIIGRPHAKLTGEETASHILEIISPLVREAKRWPKKNF